MAKIDFERVLEVQSQVQEERFLREEREREAAERAAKEKRFEVQSTMPPLIKAGTRIWRAVYHYRDGLRIADYVSAGAGEQVKVEEDRSGRPVGILRAIWGVLSVREPIWYAVGGYSRRGMVCLCYDDLPGNWTYLQVVRVSASGKSCIVRPVVGDKAELLSKYE